MHHSAGSLAPVLSWLLALLCAVSGGYCLLRGRRAGGRADAVMGFGMAAMALPLGGAGRPVHLALGAVFCAASVQAAWRLRGGRHHVHHLVGSLAMVHMTLWPGVPPLTGGLLVYYSGYVLWGGSRLAGGPAGLTGACRLAMGIGMFAMLLTL
ncbi:DUF5134 domain-containing protein [Streptomyces venezuelae]|uniref:DUF5134 domain-containing protein n=1 Tax=Streptomyces venezuelae TaxID=54571 RepID=A0A5P2DEL0_STRVZ|nr:DUF5134 domain-containing protein [Streptomyces venezuelae]QES51509.1 DUF5134 domain-containing protein [Streptomyces venezuelae]